MCNFRSQNTVDYTLKEPLLRVITECLILSMNDTINFDAVVIGAGVVGLAIANELCDIYDNVIVIDKESDFGQHVSSRHSGVIHSGIYYAPGSLKAKLCVEGNDLIYNFAKSKNIGYLNCGKLVVGHNQEDLEKLKLLMEKGVTNEVHGLKILSSDEARKIESLIKCENALWVPSTGIIDSHGVMSELSNEIESKNGVIHYNSEVEKIDRIDNSYNLKIGNEETIINSPIVINSAGLWCDAVSRMLGIDEYKIHYCKGDYYKSNKYKDLNCLIYPLPEKIGLGIHTVLQLDGSISFGPSAYYVDKLDYSVNEKNRNSFYKSIRKYIDIEKEDLTIDYSGIRPKPFGPDDEPKDFIIKNEIDKGYPNFINLIGIESPGLTSSLAIGKYVKNICLKIQV